LPRVSAWKVLRECRLEGDGAQHAVLGIADSYDLVAPGR